MDLCGGIHVYMDTHMLVHMRFPEIMGPNLDPNVLWLFLTDYPPTLQKEGLAFIETKRHIPSHIYRNPNICISMYISKHFPYK